MTAARPRTGRPAARPRTGRPAARAGLITGDNELFYPERTAVRAP
jgi:hypothetical protein